MAEYTYNARNQIAATVVENGVFTATRSYDTAGRLTGISNGTLDTTAYTLSADGRRTATTNGTTTSYTTNNVNEYTTISGGGFQPPSPSYDNNGNSLILPRPDGTALTLGWDINNQQISATNGAGDTATYQYDALGRRTKRSETIGGLTTHTYFFTNGWNVELEYSGSQYTKRMTWGKDLSGNLQVVGGVGGLIMVEDLTGSSAVPHFPTYDGNGNITAWVDNGGTVIATQRYDAFGTIIEQIGTAPSNYGFSTKPIEKVTGLLYYGYRYYDPITGRWPSRDPIEERGGVNLYGLVGNDGIGKWDVLGLDGYGIGDYILRYNKCCPNDVGKFGKVIKGSGGFMAAVSCVSGAINQKKCNEVCDKKADECASKAKSCEDYDNCKSELYVCSLACYGTAIAECSGFKGGYDLGKTIGGAIGDSINKILY